MFPNLQHFAATILAQTGASPGGCAEGNAQLIFPLAMVAILYFIWMRPMSKERRTHAQLLDSLKRGDDVLTSSGLFGKVADITPKTVTLEVAKNVKIRVLKTSISRRAEDAESIDKAEAASKAPQK
ncbi:MAG: preprotein translocase subunit YajC [Deltaproteobacteria bacterium]|nr:preprotein translocase subunit YajC [Deltaproteobacteria bacterium]